MSPLSKKLFRDLWRVRTQAVAIALVMDCGITIMLMSFGAMRSLSETRDAYYDSYRFANVFAEAKRAPLIAAAKIAAIPGVAAIDARIVRYVTLDIPGLEQPAIGGSYRYREAGRATPTKSSCARGDCRAAEATRPC